MMKRIMIHNSYWNEENVFLNYFFKYILNYFKAVLFS